MPKITLKDTLSTIASLQQKLNMANGTVAELIKEVQTVKQYAKKVDAQNEILRESNATLHAEIETLKKDRDNFERNFNNVNECYEGIYDNYEKLKVDYAELQENYTELNKMHNDLIDSHNKVTAENYALKAEIERTNRHINLAENVIHEAKEQQPLVVNHYHNCVINK